MDQNMTSETKGSHIVHLAGAIMLYSLSEHQYKWWAVVWGIKYVFPYPDREEVPW